MTHLAVDELQQGLFTPKIIHVFLEPWKVPFRADTSDSASNAAQRSVDPVPVLVVRCEHFPDRSEVAEMQGGEGAGGEGGRGDEALVVASKCLVDDHGCA